VPKFGNVVDFSKFEAQNMRLQNLAGAPGTPVVGQEYYDTVLGHAYVWNGSGWEQASGGGGSGTVSSVALAAPAWLSVTGSPVTSAGTITLAAAAGQTAGQVLATPTSTGAVALRALDHTYISDFDTQVRTSRLDQLAAPTVAVALNGQKITNLATPTTGTDAANKGYVDTVAQGLAQKPTAQVATTGALPANTYANGTAGVGATLTATANGALTVDGYAVATGDRVLVKDEATAANNGLYMVTQPGSGATPYILTRDPEMDTAAEFAGAFIPVEDAGTANANSLWLCTNTAAPVVGTTAIVFTQLNKGTDLAAGTGISITGNSVAVSATYAGQASIVTVGTLTTGVWQGTAVAVGFGGTGSGTAAGARTNLGAKGSYTATIGDGATTSFAITQATHGLAGNGQILVGTYDATTGDRVYPNENVNNSNGTVTIAFGTAPATNAYRVVLIG
jgi:hypothetical protein